MAWHSSIESPLMSHLNEYLSEKRAAVLARSAAIEAGTAQAARLKASVRAEGRSGVRRLRIREHQVISDSPPDFAGYNLGPSSPELQLGVLGTCVTHIFLIQAAERQVPLESLEVEVTGVIDPRGGKPGHEATPIWPHDIGYTVHIDSPASRAEIDALFEAVERTCPILNLLRNPQSIRAEVRHTGSSAPERLAA
ncbi:MAG: OsmC family protein [Comamonas thiooxydans]